MGVRRMREAHSCVGRVWEGGKGGPKVTFSAEVRLGLDKKIVLFEIYVKICIFRICLGGTYGPLTLYNTRARPTMGRDAGAGVYWTVWGGCHADICGRKNLQK